MDPKTRIPSKDWDGYTGDTALWASDGREISVAQIKGMLRYFNELMWYAETHGYYRVISVDNYKDHLERYSRQQTLEVPGGFVAEGQNHGAKKVEYTTQNPSGPQSTFSADRGFSHPAINNLQPSP